MEVMRLALSLSCRRFLWQRRSFPVTTSIKAFLFRPLPLAHFGDPGRSLPSASVRFYSKDIVQSGEHTLSHTPPFFELLRHCSSPAAVLDLTSCRAPSGGQISNCLKQMWHSTKKMTEEQRRRELKLMFDHPALPRLLESATWNAYHMSSKSVVHSLACMVKLGVPQSSRVVQTLLRICQERLNDLDEKLLNMLAQCLNVMENTPNVHAFKEGMRLLLFEIRFPEIKNAVSIHTMISLMERNGPVELKWKVEEKALSLADQFNPAIARRTLLTMAAVDFHSKPLLDMCTMELNENLNRISFNRLLSILNCHLKLRFRDFTLLTSISEHVFSMVDSLTTKKLIIFLSVLGKLRFYHAALMEAFAEKVIANPDALQLEDLLCVLRVYSTLDYDVQHHRQQFLDSLSQAVDAHLPEMSNYELLKTACYLCILNHFPSAPLEQLLQSSTLEQLQTEDASAVRNQRMLHTVDLCLRIDCPRPPTPLIVPSIVLEEPAHSMPVEIPWLSQSLQSVVGDQVDAVLEESVEDYYFIDGVITKRLPDQSAVTEASSPAESSQRIAVICSPSAMFCTGTTKPCGRLAVKARHLKILGYEPVLVKKEQLEAMSQEQRTEFLRERIFPEHHRWDTQPQTKTDVGA